jgi:phage baseplate assembly protein gpV
MTCTSDALAWLQARADELRQAQGLPPALRPGEQRVIRVPRDADARASTITAIAKRNGMSPSTLRNRLGAGWSLNDALATPPAMRGAGAAKMRAEVVALVAGRT